MGKNITPPLTESHTGWTDDDLFAAAMESQAFALFDAEMDEALDSLVARWSHHAAPNAQMLRRSFKFPSAKPVNKPR